MSSLVRRLSNLGSSTTPKIGYDWLDFWGMPEDVACSVEEATDLWARYSLTDTMPKVEADKAYEKVMELLINKYESRASPAIQEQLKGQQSGRDMTPKEVERFTKHRGYMRGFLREELKHARTKNYFMRAVKLSYDGLIERQAFIDTLVAGGVMQGHEDFKWNNYGKYMPPSSLSSLTDDSKQVQTPDASVSLRRSPSLNSTSATFASSSPSSASPLSSSSTSSLASSASASSLSSSSASSSLSSASFSSLVRTPSSSTSNSPSESVASSLPPSASSTSASASIGSPSPSVSSSPLSSPVLVRTPSVPVPVTVPSSTSTILVLPPPLPLPKSSKSPTSGHNPKDKERASVNHDTPPAGSSTTSTYSITSVSSSSSSSPQSPPVHHRTDSKLRSIVI